MTRADLSAFSRVEEYRELARIGDLTALSGRRGQAWLTDYVADSALARVPLSAGQVLVDIGSGDGTFMRKAYAACPGLRFLIGITPVEEERDFASSALASIPHTIIKGSLLDTNLATATADVVASIGAFLLEQDVNGSLREIARIAKPGAYVFIGGVPHTEEPQAPQPSLFRVIASNLKHRGIRAALQVVLFAAKAKGRLAKPYVVIDARAMRTAAQDAGLNLIEHWVFTRPDESGTIITTRRSDYLFVRV